MSVLLFVVGAIAVMAGVGMIGYGIPINEFSFGNTLIIAGTTAAAGGLVVIALGVVVGHLQRIGEMLATRTPIRSSRPFETFEVPSGARAASPSDRIPFPPRPKTAAALHEPEIPVAAPAPVAAAVEEHPAADVAPMLQNPDVPFAVVEEFESKEYEEASLSPQQSVPAPAKVDVMPGAEKPSAPAFDASWRSSPVAQPQEPPARPSYFDAMWPGESKPAKHTASDAAKPEPLPPKPAAPQVQQPEKKDEPPVAILKSGVVDGMGYTLYVDGSIEAELPQGTLRFASINELRSHLAKNS
jgi:hypothetical protein